MPLTKRLVFNPTNFASPDQLQDHEAEDTLQAHSFCKMLGSMRQLSHLSAYALEVFHHLTQLVEDVDQRTKAITRKTETVYKKLADVEKGLRTIPLQPDIKVSSYSSKYLKGRQMTTPPIFIRSTNYSSVLQQYKSCRHPPQLWRIENMIGEDCFQYYSYPGYFFQEWLRSELLRQEAKKRQRKKDRALRKQLRKEKKRLREQALVSKYQSTQRMVSLKKRALVVEATVDHAEDYNQEQDEADGHQVTHLQKETSKDHDRAELKEPLPPLQHTPATGSPMKKAGIAAVFGFLAAKDKKKVDDDEDGNRSADEVQGDNTKLGASHPVAALTTSKVDFKVTTTASSARPSLTKADSMSMQILGKSLEQKTEERETNIRWAEPTTDSAHRQDDEEDVDAVLWNNKTVPSNNEVDAEDIAKHFHISMNRRQARNQVSSKRAAKFLSKAPKEGEKGINLLIHKKAVSEIEVADYAPVNAATNASPMSSRKFISADDDLSFAAQQSGSTEQNKHQPKMSNGPLNAKKRASVIGMVGISQFYQMSPVSEVKERDRNEELLESIMADMLTEDALKSPTTEYEEPSLIDEYSVNLGESLIDEIDNNTEKYSNPESKPRYSYPDDPPEDDDDLEDLPPDEDDSFPPEEDSLPPLSEFDVLPESEPGDDSRSQLSFPSVPSSKPSNVGSRPPPPPPPKVAVKSALNMDVLSQIKGGGASLRTAETQPRERVVDLRTGLMNSIKAGSAQLRNVAPVVKPKFISTVRQNEAVAAILANRSKIAGSDSESDSDSDYTDDDYG